MSTSIAPQAKLRAIVRLVSVARSETLTPNPSLNRTRYGKPSWPGLRYAVHFLSPGQAALPQRAG